MLPSAKPIRRLARTIAAGSAAAQSWKVLLVLLVVAVSYLALTPHPPARVDTGWDKLNHLLAFTALAFSASLSYPASRRTHVLLLCALLAFGGLIEILQLFVPGRSSEWGDLFADSIGIVCGVVVASLVLRIAPAPTLRSY